MKETTAQQRMDLLKEIADAGIGTIQEWLKHWQRDNGENVRLRYFEDGTTVVELDNEVVMSVHLAVDVSMDKYVDAVNEPTGFVLKRTWSTVPAGWFVRTPKGDWIEVMSTTREGGQQMVTLDVSGQRKAWPRDPAGEVDVRRGTLVDKSMDEAITALGDVSILEDVPFDGPYVARGES